MKGSNLRLYWDTSVWIAWNKNEHDIRSLCTDLLKDALAGKLEIVLSPLVIAEFVPSPNEDDDISFLNFLKHHSFIQVGISWKIAFDARSLVKKFSYCGLGGTDAIHLACALFAKANYLFSYDRHHLNIAKDVTGITICEPIWPYDQMRIFFDEVASTEE